MKSKKFFKLVLAAVLLLSVFAAACSDGDDDDNFAGAEVVLLGTDAAKAQQQVAAAIYRYNQIGEAAFDEISDSSGPFIDGEIYVYVLTPEGVNRAHAANPSLVGDDLFELEDSEGVKIVQGIIETANSGGGWALYRFGNPVTGNEEPKNSWVVPHDGLIFGSGDYVTEAEFEELRNNSVGTEVVLLGTDAAKAQQQVAAAIYRYNQIGEAAFDEISDSSGPFIDGEIYVYVLTPEGVNRAHAANPSLVGDDLFELEDSEGVKIVQGIIETANSGGGWALYRFGNPVTGNEEPKNSWVVPHDGFIFGSGDYVTEAEFEELRN